MDDSNDPLPLNYEPPSHPTTRRGPINTIGLVLVIAGIATLAGGVGLLIWSFYTTDRAVTRPEDLAKRISWSIRLVVFGAIMLVGGLDLRRRR